MPTLAINNYGSGRKQISEVNFAVDSINNKSLISCPAKMQVILAGIVLCSTADLEMLHL